MAGAVALALAGVFLVKYSIDTGLLSPAVRVILGFLFGIGILYGGHRVSTRPEFPNGNRIAQAPGRHRRPVCGLLRGDQSLPPAAGLCRLHGNDRRDRGGGGALFAARKTDGFARAFGRLPDAALVSSPRPHAGVPLLLSIFVLSGLMVVIRKRAAWSLGIPAVLGAYSWVSVWLSAPLRPGGYPVARPVSFGRGRVGRYWFEGAVRKDGKDMADFSTFTSALTASAVGGAIVLMGLTTAWGGFDMTGWFLYGLLSVGTLVLARYNEKLYSLAPFVSAAVNAVMLWAWRYGGAREFVPVIA